MGHYLSGDDFEMCHMAQCQLRVRVPTLPPFTETLSLHIQSLEGGRVCWPCSGLQALLCPSARICALTLSALWE